jgi:hypothetical protein
MRLVGAKGPVFDLSRWCIIGLDYVPIPQVFSVHFSITTPIASALKKYYTQRFLEAPAGILFINYFWIQVAVSLLKEPSLKRVHI